MRILLIANGAIAPNTPIPVAQWVIAADGGAHRSLQLGITPQVVIGDFDSLPPEDQAILQARGASFVRHPARKDFTDLELALQYALELRPDEILILGALGSRWDQTLANLLLPSAPGLLMIPIRILDGAQEIQILRPGVNHILFGQPRDTVSLIPVGGDAHGIETDGLEYPLRNETLFFGATRGVSNQLLGAQASVQFQAGWLLCVIIHHTP
jgi:thiamine pyrophosphokinase